MATLQKAPEPDYSNNSCVPAHLNVASDPQLREDVAHFLKWGYLVLPDALDIETLALLRAAIDDLVAKYSFRNDGGGSVAGIISQGARGGRTLSRTFDLSTRVEVHSADTWNVRATAQRDRPHRFARNEGSTLASRHALAS